MAIYYETHERNRTVAHDTLADAVAYAEGHKVFSITEVGGRYDEWVRCELCGEWTVSEDISREGYCPICKDLARGY